jgi:hypothetical protein
MFGMTAICKLSTRKTCFSHWFYEKLQLLLDAGQRLLIYKQLRFSAGDERSESLALEKCRSMVYLETL